MKKKTLRKYCHKNRTFTKTERFFYEWLSQNIHRFHHRLIRFGTHTFNFAGITKQVYLAINMQQMEAMLVLNDKNGDWHDLIVIEYIGNFRYDAQKGYYDADNIEKTYIYYPTLKKLLITQVFEKIITFCNELFVPEKCLYLYSNQGCTWHKIGLASDQLNATNSTHLIEVIKFDQ